MHQFDIDISSYYIVDLTHIVSPRSILEHESIFILKYIDKFEDTLIFTTKDKQYIYTSLQKSDISYLIKDDVYVICFDLYNREYLVLYNVNKEVLYKPIDEIMKILTKRI